MSVYILGIESSCDDTAAAVLKDDILLSNVIASQEVHRNFGGVVPELASRAHQQNIIPVIDQALTKANISKKDLHAIAYTRGPGLLGSLLVGSSFAKSFALGLNIPLIDVNHLEAHIQSIFLRKEGETKTIPSFPFLCLTVSGGHTQIVRVDSHHEMTIVGRTIDDAAGEAFDKAAKIMGLPYPGGPHIDRLAKEGNPHAFEFPRPRIKELDYSFSGLKTSFLYRLRDELKKNPDFIEENKADLAASIQYTIIDILMDKLKKAVKTYDIKTLVLAGGVSANSGLRNTFQFVGKEKGWDTHIPAFEYTTDNAAMIAMSGYYKFLNNDFADLSLTPYARS